MCGFHQPVATLINPGAKIIFIPDDFNIPDHLVNEQFRFAVLEQSLVAIDYEAVMSSKERLRQVFAKNDDWPANDMTVDFNRNDLIEHENEFKVREAFAFAVFSASKDRYIGCFLCLPHNGRRLRL
jgi:hypothetical protein